MVMFVICGVILLVIVMSLSSSGNGRPPIIMCNSVSCTHNKLCRCTRKEVSVYDNTVTGLCLDHTDSMKDRVLEPMRKSKLLEQYEHETYTVRAMDRVEEKFKDEELLKSPSAFARWMNMRGMERHSNEETDD